MKAVMASIRHEHCQNIIFCKKALEVRKNRPNLKTPFKVYIYETKRKCKGQTKHTEGAGHVIGEFVCDRIYSTCGWRIKGNTGRVAPRQPWEETFPAQACLSLDEIITYAGNENRLVYGWHISELKVYDVPKPLSDFTPFCQYMMDDETCNHREVACNQQRFDYNPWPDCSLNMVECTNKMQKPPQSWCYVVELKGGERCA